MPAQGEHCLGRAGRTRANQRTLVQIHTFSSPATMKHTPTLHLEPLRARPPSPAPPHLYSHRASPARLHLRRRLQQPHPRHSLRCVTTRILGLRGESCNPAEEGRAARDRDCTPFVLRRCRARGGSRESGWGRVFGWGGMDRFGNELGFIGAASALLRSICLSPCARLTLKLEPLLLSFWALLLSLLVHMLNRRDAPPFEPNGRDAEKSYPQPPSNDRSFHSCTTFLLNWRISDPSRRLMRRERTRVRSSILLRLPCRKRSAHPPRDDGGRTHHSPPPPSQ